MCFNKVSVLVLVGTITVRTRELPCTLLLCDHSFEGVGGDRAPVLLLANTRPLSPPPGPELQLRVQLTLWWRMMCNLLNIVFFLPLGFLV